MNARVFPGVGVFGCESYCHRGCNSRRYAAYLRWGPFLGAWLVLAGTFSTPLVAANLPLVMHISNETAPSGGFAQVKIFLDTPEPLAAGAISMTFDPTVFGPISEAKVFSANGNAYGYASFGQTPQMLEVVFMCGFSGSAVEDPPMAITASGGLGQVRNLPILVVNIPILSTAVPGTIGQITAIPDEYAGPAIDLNPFADPNGNQYDASIVSGSVTIGGTLSIQSVNPGGGWLPTGTIVGIKGTGFTSASTVQIGEVALSGVQFIDAEDLAVTLGAPADLTGKPIMVANSDGQTAQYFSFLLVGTISGNALLPSFYPLFTDQPSSATVMFSIDVRTGWYVIQNPNLIPAVLTINTFFVGVAGSPTQQTVTVQPGGTWAYYLPSGTGINGSIASSQPIRALLILNELSTVVRPVFPPGPAPFIASIANGASQIAEPIAPGETITIHGAGVGGPSAAEVQVLFDNTPGLILYSSSTQINVVVPNEVAGKTSTNASVILNGDVSVPGESRSSALLRHSSL
jgi:hypothetical protein